MSKSLLIVESPTKAKTLGRYLGKDFIVKASVGHVKDLPKNKLGINLEQGFEPEYQIIRGKKKVLTELHSAAVAADAVYLGPDPDREGEAIAWHIAEEIRAKNKPIYRVLFYELTQKAIQEALSHPQQLNKSLYEAQQARRILDRLVGYLISPILWEKVKRGLSAGRVQSVALRLICNREREIQKFDAEEYWTIEAQLIGAPGEADKAPPRSFISHLMQCHKKKCKISTGREAEHLLEVLRPLSFVVESVERKNRKKNPAPPFITSTLQQDAARKLRFSAKQTMSVAQKLYEGLELGEEGAVGLITYMRTDSTRLSQEAVQAARVYIEETWGKNYLPGKPAIFKSKSSAQDAHEAIRPTDVRRTPQSISSFLTREQLNLYTLIWKRFVACQMAPAIIAQTTIDIAAGDFIFRSTGSVVEFPGFMTLYVEGQDNGDAAAGDGEGYLPELAKGQSLSLLDLISKQHFTQPPPRFSEASLIKELEELGIGRPSTYATILSTIMDREYVRLEKQRLYPSELGWLIDGLLVENFPNIVDVDFTAKLEKNLDEIEHEGHSSSKLLTEFYDQFSKDLDAAQTNMLNLKGMGWPTDLKCPQCERPLHIRWSRNGPFITCSGYPECSFSSDYVRDEKGNVKLVEAQPTGETCEKCGRPMILKRGRYGTFLACSGYPECKSTRSPSSGIPCPREGCAGELVERVGKGGRRFYGCNKYPECKTVFWGKPVQKKCPLCDSPVLVEKVTKRSGVKLVCPNASCKYEEKERSGPEEAD
ncbi:type I DNA topoisomerase [Desulforhabdus sp. TSK]|uniref:type I DNA topoisomerase n=1 Tax=Desulforhabdus sp. TSK TaxID=2925014 RepID=UPI001FC89D14|nr:type I DNA topoisomerase [Desulforhabdus sp. TSK]GKT08158.1 DNA topoisomerase 1 [Desulforhabdus sp. TSK]